MGNVCQFIVIIFLNLSIKVRVHYKRYLQSFEELHKTLGCTMLQYPRGGRHSTGTSSRVQIRGKHRSVTASEKEKTIAY